VALSGQIARERRLETIATNVANMNSAGYRATGISFEAMATPANMGGVTYSTSGQDFISQRTGAISKTDNPLDVAIKGDGWFGVRTSSGVAYTRDGRLQISSSGSLETINGDAVLDAGGASLSTDPRGGSVVIASDGMISQGGRELGAIGLFSFEPDAKLARAANNAVTPDLPARAILDFTKSGVAQGYVESSNVDPVLEMTKLIAVTREFDDINGMISQTDSSLNDAIKTLGSPN
jgi:flagellar basal-body rod protein FlgF